MTTDSRRTTMTSTTISWGWRIAIVYTTFAVATLSFVAFAMTQKVDLVRQDYYEHSLHHDRTMAARNAAQLLSQRPAMFDVSRNVVDISIPTAPQHQAELRLYRPSTSALDTTVIVTTDDNGNSHVDCSRLATGHWTATLRWKMNDIDYEYELPLHIVAR